MHWQFGGNLEPVQMMCEIDWKECPRAIASYVWSEIVTDVLDCLGNESIVWRVLGVFFVCTILVRWMYSKSNHMNNVTVDKEMLNKVGYKVEDLELKVHVLTYKMQYGSWPLPHQIRKSSFRKNLRNVRLTLSNLSDRNDWIKHILMSPRRNESYISYSKYSYPSKHQLTELFDAKKKTMYPYLRRDLLSMERSSKSSKSSSDKSFKFNAVYRKRINRKQRKMSKSENFEVRHRNAILFPLFSRKRSSKSTSKISRNSNFLKADRVAGSCRKFTKTMDECKRYLRELHESNKRLGLVCSSSDLSDGPSTRKIWSETQRQRYVHKTDPINLNEKFKQKSDETAEETNVEQEMNLKETNLQRQSKENCLEVSNKMYPVLKVIDKNVLPTTMNITFCSEMFPQQSVTNMLIPQACERPRFIESSQEALNQVRSRLESLHNVLRTYEMQSPETRPSENNNKISNICQNVVDTLVSVTTDVNNWTEKRSKVSFDDNAKKNSSEIQQTIYYNSEQYESDETGRSSVASIQNYSNVFNVCANNINNFHYSILEKLDPQICSSTVKYEQIPERVYYSLSSESFDGKDGNKITAVTENFTTLPGVYIESNRMKSYTFSDQCTAPMETDEDVVITSPTSSRTEASRDTESDEKSTALLLHEALQIKRALLTRVELEKICYTDENSENNEFISEHDTYSYDNNNLESKLLDIISEEQSVSSSTEKASRTYMFFNIKQDKQLAFSPTCNNNGSDFAQQNEIIDRNPSTGYFDSKHNLGSPSEYFSFSNMIQDENGMNSSQMYLSQHNLLQKNESVEMMPCNLQIKYVNNGLDKSDDKIVKMQFESCLNGAQRNVNEHGVCYGNTHEREHFEKHSLHTNNVNEFMNQNSVELFSENLNESLPDEDNSNGNETPKFVNTETTTQCTTVSLKKTILNSSNNETYMEDNEMLTCSPNLTLKRHPGTCSLIEQTLTGIENTSEIRNIIENADTMFDLSASDSKENSIETNLIQDSLTSSINQSNDSNIPEPSSVTALINKSTDGEELNLNWSDVKNNCNYVDEENIQSLSRNTIILQNYNAVHTESFNRQKLICTEGTSTEMHDDQNNQLNDRKSNTITKNSLVDLDKEDSINKTGFYKSYCNLISPHSSIYFTDEASSSAAKINNTYSKDVDGYLHSNLYTQIGNAEGLRYENTDSKHVKNSDSFSISVLNESKTVINTEESYMKVSNNVYNNEETKPDSDNKLNDESKTSSIKNDLNTMDVPSINEIKKILKTESENVNDNRSTSYSSTDKLLLSKNINVTGKIQSHLLTNKKETLNVDENTFSPREKENTEIRRINTRSPENNNSKLEGQKKSISTQNVKGLKSDLLNTSGTSNNTENNRNSSHKRKRDLSIESKSNTEHTIKVDKRRSRSQISMLTNESSTPSNNNTVSDTQTQSMETKSKLMSHNKYLLPTPRTSSKSCIPILKSRLEAARRFENETRPKSPMRGPLTMTMFWRDNLCTKNQNAMQEIQVEGKSESNAQCVEQRNSYSNKMDDSLKYDLLKTSHTIENINKKQEQMVIYVNIFTKYDHNATKIVNPNKFLEYIKSRELNIQNVLEENQSVKQDKEDPTIFADKEKSTVEKIVTIVSSVINGNELDDRTTSADLFSAKKKSESFADTLSNEKLRNMCFLSVEQREVDVTAKPSVIDISTSVSDLEHAARTSKSILDKFQICGTPKELNNEEYISLLEILYQERNFIHLQELETICKKLVSEHENPK